MQVQNSRKGRFVANTKNDVRSCRGIVWNRCQALGFDAVWSWLNKRNWQSRCVVYTPIIDLKHYDYHNHQIYSNRQEQVRSEREAEKRQETRNEERLHFLIHDRHVVVNMSHRCQDAEKVRYMRVVLRVQRHWRVVTARKRFANQVACHAFGRVFWDLARAVSSLRAHTLHSQWHWIVQTRSN